MIIDTFHADYVVSKESADPFALKKRFDKVAADFLGRELEPLLARIPLDPSTLVFIKKLSVHLVLDPAKTDDRAAAGLWARRIIAAVAEIARTVTASFDASGAAGKETGSNVALFQSRAAYFAHFIHDLLGGAGPPGDVLNRWYYSQFGEFSSFSPVHIVKLLCKQNRHIIPGVFALLEQMGRTEKILGSMNGEDARFLYSLLPGEAGETKETGLHEEVLRFIADIIRRGFISTEFIYSNLRDYKLCLKIYMLFLIHQKKYPVFGSCDAVKEVIREIVIESPGSIILPGDGESKKAERGVGEARSDYGGLFLLIPVLREMYLIDILRVSSLPDRGDISAVNALLFSTASAVVRQNRDPVAHPYIDAADPGFFIFAGLEPNVPLQHLQDYPKIITPTMCSEFLSSLTKVFGSPETFFQKGFWPPEASSYEAVVSSVSELALRLFARRLKGFEASSGAYLFTHFLQRSSKIHWDRRGIRVTLSPGPLDSLLRMSGLLDETGGVPWLGDRNVTFRLRGE